MSAHRRQAGLFCLALALGTTMPGCREDPASDPTRDDAGSESGDEGPPRPSFAEPASGRIDVPSDRREDLVLMVTGVVPGQTELVIDGQGMGPLHDESRVGRLEATSLRLHVRGSLVPGQHRMYLRTADASGVAESEIVDITISTNLVIQPAATLDQAGALIGDRVVAIGHDADAMLLAIQTTDDEPRLHLAPWTDDGWDAAAARTLSLPGLVLDPQQRLIPVSALRRARVDDGPGRVRVAWRVDRPGTRIDLLDVAWEMANVGVEPQLSLTLEDALGGRAAEWAQLGRPWLLADQVLASLHAPTDVESPRPGDRAVVSARIEGDAVELAPPQRVTRGTDEADLDALGPGIDRIAAMSGRTAPVSLRSDQHQPLALEHDAASGVLRFAPTEVDGRERSLSLVDIPLATIVGAFGSRTVAGATLDAGGGRMQVVLIDDLGDGGIDSFSLATGDVPALGEATGALVPGVVDGVTVFLLPFGSLQPVYAIYTAGTSVRTRALSELWCDSVALAPMEAADGTVPLACALDGEVSLGRLSSESIEVGGG